MLSLGEVVRYRERTYVVAGFRPRSQSDDRVLIEHVLSRELLWVEPSELERDADEDRPTTPVRSSVYDLRSNVE